MLTEDSREYLGFEPPQIWIQISVLSYLTSYVYCLFLENGYSLPILRSDYVNPMYNYQV